MLNKVMLIGHLGADPDIRATQDGRKIANFTMATSENWKDKNTGDRHERTEWHRVVVFNDGLVGVIEKYLRKGSKIYIEGMLQTRKWEDKDGITRYTTEIVLKAFNGQLNMLDTQGSGRPPAAESEDEYGKTRTRESGEQDRGQQPAEDAPSYDPDLDDEIPF